jgi:hypothetical protein
MYAMTHIASSLAAPPFPKGSGTYALDVPTPPTTPNVDAQAWVFVADAEKWVGDSRLVPDDVFQWAKNGGQGETYSQGRYWYVVRGSQSGSQDPFTIYGPIYIYRSQVMSQGGLAGCPMGVECVTDKLHGGTTGAAPHGGGMRVQTAMGYGYNYIGSVRVPGGVSGSVPADALAYATALANRHDLYPMTKSFGSGAYYFYQDLTPAQQGHGAYKEVMVWRLGPGVNPMDPRTIGPHGTGAPQLARTHTHQPMQHDSDHWVEVSIHDVPVGVRTMLQPGGAWKAFRTTGTHQRWWGVGPDGKYYVHLSHGGVDALGAPGLGADLTGAQAPCCPSNATWGVAAAIFVGAGMITWAIAAKHKKTR